mmetsp:Transcript_10502/g.23902  ORF Transcript_10502/g.23902 Transcript_10502/m.23902 type:complete len:230 (+) Transcript_10502:1737-2426(+)
MAPSHWATLQRGAGYSVRCHTANAECRYDARCSWSNAFWSMATSSGADGRQRTDGIHASGLRRTCTAISDVRTDVPRRSTSVPAVWAGGPGNAGWPSTVRRQSVAGTAWTTHGVPDGPDAHDAWWNGECTGTTSWWMHGGHGRTGQIWWPATNNGCSDGNACWELRTRFCRPGWWRVCAARCDATADVPTAYARRSVKYGGRPDVRPDEWARVRSVSVLAAGEQVQPIK